MIMSNQERVVEVNKSLKGSENVNHIVTIEIQKVFENWCSDQYCRVVVIC